VTGKPAWSSVLGALRDWAKADRAFAAFAKRVAKNQGEGRAVERVKASLAPVLYPGNIYCAGANYTSYGGWRAPGQGAGSTMKGLGEKPGIS